MRRFFTIFTILILGLFIAPATSPAHAAWMGLGSGTELDKCTLQDSLAGRCYQFDLNDMGLVWFNCKIAPWKSPDGCTNNELVFQQLQKTSTLASVGRTVTALYENKPTSLALWGQDMGYQLGFMPKPVYAQGIGFSGLQPLLGIWKAMRNIAYGLLACVMVIIGFMIMFRKKIDPKTVVTVQNALPKVVISMLLITFSYAIAALMIDLMYLVMMVGLTILQNTSGLSVQNDTSALANTVGININVPSNVSLAALYMNGGLWTLFTRVFDPLWQAGYKMNLHPPAAPVGDFFANPGTVTQTILANMGSSVGGAIKGATIDVIMGFILRIAYLIAFVRLLFMLISAYINIIVAVITAPIQLLLEAMPGSTSFESWIKNLIVNLMPFPITAFFLTLGSWMATGLESGGLWTAPLLPNVADATPGLAISLIWLGFVFMIPSIVGGLKESMKAKPAIQAGFGAVFGPIGSGGGQLMQLGYQATFMASPFLHKVPPSSPLPRAMDALKGGLQLPSSKSHGT